MEKMTRTKKYAELRKQIQHDSETEIKSKELSEYANKLNRINDDFDAMEVNEDTSYNKAHNRKVLIDTSEFAITKEDTIEVSKEDTVEIEILKEDNDNSVVNKYIDEVKEYNMEKGLLSDTDTQLNIINTIRKKPNKNIIRPFGDIDLDEGVDLSVNAEKYHTEEETETAEENPFYDESFMDTLPDSDSNNISKELDDILNEIRENQHKEKITLEAKEMDVEEITDVDSKDEFTDEMLSEEIIEETTEDIPVEETDEEISLAETVDTSTQEVAEETMEDTTVYNTVYEDVTEELQKTETTEIVAEERRSEGLINFIIIILVILLLIVIGVFAYFVLMDRGII